MKFNIVIRVESNNFKDKNKNLVSDTEASLNELSKPVFKHSQLTQKNNKNYFLTPLQTDSWISRIVVSTLALTLVSSIIGAVWLQSQNKLIPNIIIDLGTGALGGLSRLLKPIHYKD